MALTRKSNGRFRSSSRSSADEHEGLDISSVMGDERGKLGTGTWRSGCVFRLEVILSWFMRNEISNRDRTQYADECNRWIEER